MVPLYSDKFSLIVLFKEWFNPYKVTNKLIKIINQEFIYLELIILLLN